MAETATGPIVYTDFRGTIPKETWNQWVKQITTKVVTKTANYTATDEDGVILCNGTFTITLPAVADNTNKVYHIKNIGTGVITVTGNGSETIDKETDQTLDEQYMSMMIVSDATEWWVV